jgi:hypothetical protein
MKKITLTFILILIINSIFSQTITPPNLITLEELIDISGQGFNLNDVPSCEYTPISSFSLVANGVTSTGSKIQMPYTSGVIDITGANNSNVTFNNLRFNCPDRKDIVSLELQIIKRVVETESYDCSEETAKTCYRTCGFRDQLGNIIIVPFQYNNINSIPDNITQIQSAICANGGAYNLQYQTNNIYDKYLWYKNSVFVSETMNSISPFITVEEGDKIGLKGGGIDPCEIDSPLFETTVSVVNNATIALTPVNTNACFNDTFVINATSTNATNVSWYENSTLTTPVPSNFLTGTNGDQVTIPANFTGSKTYYANSTNENNCNSEIKSVTLTTYLKPVVQFVTNESTSFCKNTNAVFTALGTSIKTYKWYENSDGTGEITNGLSGISRQELTYNTDLLNTGVNKVYVRAISNDNCYGDIKEVSFTIITSSGTISTVSKTEYCKNETVNISLSSATSISYEWYEDENMNISAPNGYLQQSGGNFSYTTNIIGSKKWYYRGLSSSGCYTELYDIDIVTNNAPENLNITNAGASFCTNTIATFEASANGVSSYKFYKNASGTLPWGSSNVSGNKLSIDGGLLDIGENKFWYKAVNNSDCETELKEVSFSINQSPNKPLRSSGDLNYCLGEVVQITVFSFSASQGYEWSYTDDFNNLIEASKIGNTDASLLQYTTTETGTTTYFFRSIANGCYSESNSLEVTINPQVGAVTVNGNGDSFCQGDTVELTAGAINSDNFEWFTDSLGTIPASGITGSSRNTFMLDTNTNSQTGTTTLYVRGVNRSNCNGQLKEVSYTIKTTPSNLQLFGETEYCTGDTVLLIPSANNATSYQWALDGNFNNLVDASKINENGALTYNTSTTENTTFFYRALNNLSCASPSKSVTIEVYKGVTELSFTNNGASFCQEETVELIVGATNATGFEWFTDSLGTISASGITGNNDNTFRLDTDTRTTTGTTILYVRGVNDSNCKSQLKEVSYTVEAKPVNLQHEGNTTVCLGESVSISLNANFANNYLWFFDINEINTIDPNWVTSIDGSTLEFTPTSLGKQRLYYKAVNSFGCSSSLKLIEINVNRAPTLLNVTNKGASFCSNETAVFEASAFNVYYFEWWKNSDLTLPLEVDFISGGNKNKVTIDTSILGEGNHTYYLVGVNSSGCKTPPLLLDFSINQIPLTPSLSGDPSVCVGDFLEMNVISNGATSYKWYYDNEKNFQIN